MNGSPGDEYGLHFINKETSSERSSLQPEAHSRLAPKSALEPEHASLRSLPPARGTGVWSLGSVVVCAQLCSVGLAGLGVPRDKRVKGRRTGGGGPTPGPAPGSFCVLRALEESLWCPGPGGGWPAFPEDPASPLTSLHAWASDFTSWTQFPHLENGPETLGLRRGHRQARESSRVGTKDNCRWSFCHPHRAAQGGDAGKVAPATVSTTEEGVAGRGRGRPVTSDSL